MLLVLTAGGVQAAPEHRSWQRHVAVPPLLRDGACSPCALLFFGVPWLVAVHYPVLTPQLSGLLTEHSDALVTGWLGALVRDSLCTAPEAEAYRAVAAQLLVTFSKILHAGGVGCALAADLQDISSLSEELVALIPAADRKCVACYIIA